MLCTKSDRNYFRGGFHETPLSRDPFEGTAEPSTKNFFGSVESLYFYENCLIHMKIIRFFRKVLCSVSL